MKVRLIVLSLFGVLLLLTAGLAVYRRSQALAAVPIPAVKPAVVRAERLQRRPYQVVESFYGLIEARAQVEMAFQIAGRISQLGPSKERGLRENEVVSPGQLLAMLEPARYAAAAEQAAAQAEEAKAALAAAQARRADARARLEDARKELERHRRLAEQNASNVREVEKADLTVQLAQAQLDVAEAQMSSASAVYDSTRAAATMAGVTLQDASLRAPMKGVVAALPVELGQMVAPGQNVVTLMDLTRVRLVLGVVERKLPLLKEGQQVTVQVQALATQAALQGGDSQAASRSGTVTLVPPAADAVTGLFRVEVELDNADGQLRPGMVGQASVLVLEQTAVAVPLEAAEKEGDGYAAWFIDEGYRAGLDLGALGQAALTVPTAVARRVVFQSVSLDKDFVLAGELPAGLDRLVVEGQERLRDGQPVTVLSDAPPSLEPFADRIGPAAPASPP